MKRKPRNHNQNSTRLGPATSLIPKEWEKKIELSYKAEAALAQ
jgi:hypothetical protein